MISCECMCMCTCVRHSEERQRSPVCSKPDFHLLYKPGLRQTASLHLHAFLCLPLFEYSLNLNISYDTDLALSALRILVYIPFLSQTVPFGRAESVYYPGHSGRSFHSKQYNWVSQTFSVKGQGVNILDSMGHYSLSSNYSTLRLQHESNHRQHVSE